MIQINETKLPSVINDPFKKKKVTAIRIHYTSGWPSPDQWRASGKVEFENGNTSGEQSFKANTFDEVVLQIKAMLDNLE